jgi:hypothetical protein
VFSRGYPGAGIAIDFAARGMRELLQKEGINSGLRVIRAWRLGVMSGLRYWRSTGRLF